MCYDTLLLYFDALFLILFFEIQFLRKIECYYIEFYYIKILT